ncbi:hypothetical protein [Rhodococcus sp. NPDC003348]
MTDTDARPIVFLDTETTGLHHDRRPWEIAMIRRDTNGIEIEQLIQVIDIDLTTAELKGLQIGGFFERYVGHNPIGADSNIEIVTEKEAAELVYITTAGAIIVGAVPNFDTEVLAAMLRRHKLCPAWHYQLVDVETLAAGWIAGREREATALGFPLRLEDRKVAPPWRSDDLSRACGVNPPSDVDRHTALGDARWVKRWYDRLNETAA